MQNVTALEFTTLVQELTFSARNAGLRPPSFRSPPHSQNQLRTIRRYHDGSALVSIAIHGRSRSEVLADMIDGVVIVNNLPAKLGVAAKRTLWRNLMQHHAEAA